MDEWLKSHTYVVYSNKQWALSAMVDYYRYHAVYMGEPIKINRTKQMISSEFRIRKYVSIYQVLHYFDGVDNVDYFELDSDACNNKTDDIVKCVQILKRAGVRRTERTKQREKFLSQL